MRAPLRIRRFANFLCALLALAFAVASAVSPAEERAADGRTGASDSALAEPDWPAIRGVIGDQLAALRAGDAIRAFSFAAPGIQQQFHDAPTFLRMVREGYAPLLDARYTQFLEGAVVEGVTIQPLRLVMKDETVLVALYRMRNDGGHWRIAGCVIAPSTVHST